MESNNDFNVTSSARIGNDQYRLASEYEISQHWWEQLPADFANWSDEFDLPLATQLMVKGTVIPDIMLRTFAASAVAALALPFSVRPKSVKDDIKYRDFYREIAEQHDPSLFFQPPPEDVEIKIGKSQKFHFQPEEGSNVTLYFDSPFETVNPALRERYATKKRNSRAWAQYWRHNDGPRPTICIIHGFIADPYWLNSRFLALPWFYQHGYDILLYTLPFHGRRQEARSPFSGQGYFSNGISHLSEAIAHSIYDFRIFLNYLLREGAGKVGVTGISLGGYTTALLAAVESRLSFAIPNVPVISILDIALEWAPVNYLFKTGMKALDMSVAEARTMTGVHCPLNYPPLLDKERLMIIGGAGDRLAPPKHSNLLWKHWNECRFHWFPGNHIIHLDQGRYLREMKAFIDATPPA